MPPALVLLALLSVLTGVIYPLDVTVLAQTLFPREASGSLIGRDGKAVGAPSNAASACSANPS